MEMKDIDRNIDTISNLNDNIKQRETKFNQLKDKLDLQGVEFHPNEDAEIKKRLKDVDSLSRDVKNGLDELKNLQKVIKEEKQIEQEKKEAPSKKIESKNETTFKKKAQDVLTTAKNCQNDMGTVEDIVAKKVRAEAQKKVVINPTKPKVG